MLVWWEASVVVINIYDNVADIHFSCWYDVYRSSVDCKQYVMPTTLPPSTPRISPPSPHSFSARSNGWSVSKTPILWILNDTQKHQVPQMMPATTTTKSRNWNRRRRRSRREMSQKYAAKQHATTWFQSDNLRNFSFFGWMLRLRIKWYVVRVLVCVCVYAHFRNSA